MQDVPASCLLRNNFLIRDVKRCLKWEHVSVISSSTREDGSRNLTVLNYSSSQMRMYCKFEYWH